MANVIQNSSQRYRGLIISIAVFLMLIGALLLYTFYTSKLLEDNTALISISNQVSNNSQAVIKDIFDLQNSYGEDVNSPHIQTVLKRLEENTKNIDDVLQVLENGGEVTDSDGHTFVLPKIKEGTALEALDETNLEWRKLKPKIESYLRVAGDIRVDSSTQLAIVGEQAKTSSLAMSNSLKDLTDDIFEFAEKQANEIRITQLIGVVAIFVYFFVFIFFFLRRLRTADEQIEVARRETTEIMETVNTGLFLLDKELNIGQQHSKALEDIIGSNRLAGENFTNVLRGRISDKDLNTTRQFIEQLYNPRVKEKLVDDLNPLKKVMLHNDNSGLGVDNRYLDFKFSRVYEDKDIARILVNVSDVSEAVRLEQRLEKERAQNDLQIEMLTTILNVSPSVIGEFISNTKKHIENMNDILKNPGSSQHELEYKGTAIYREMHSLKGEASALKLHSFTSIATEAEEKLKALQNQPKLSGNDFLPLTVQLDGLLNLSNTIETLGQRISQTVPNMNNIGEPKKHSNAYSQISAGEKYFTNSEKNSSLASFYQGFARDIAQRQNKLVTLKAPSLETIEIPSHLNAVVKDICIQLLRNAIVHGIESPQARIEAGKSDIGQISLAMIAIDGSLRITLEDDGQGINYDAIRAKLVETGQYKADAVEHLTDNQLINVLFTSGFSTKDYADEDGGRGVGLDIIRELVKENNGQMNVHSEQGKLTRFMIILPI